MKYLVLDNKRYLWRDILKLRREQRKLARNAQQALFELHDDHGRAVVVAGRRSGKTQTIGTDFFPNRCIPAK
jgi:hypothetical protein